MILFFLIDAGREASETFLLNPASASLYTFSSFSILPSKISLTLSGWLEQLLALQPLKLQIKSFLEPSCIRASKLFAFIIKIFCCL
jgi:hypothetical protein